MRGGEPFNSVQEGGLFHVVSKHPVKFGVRPLVSLEVVTPENNINYFDAVIRTQEK